MKAVGIRKVHYSDNEGNIISETVKNMVSIQASVSTRHIAYLKNDKPITSNEYFEKLLKTLLPATMKRVNFDNFIKYNFSNVLPSHTYTFENSKGITFVSIFNPDSLKIGMTQIIN